MTGAEELRQRLILQGIRLWPQDGKLRYAGPQHRITAEVLAQMKEHKEALLDHLCRPSFFPTSHGQRGIWAIHQQQPGNSAYTLSFAHRIHSLFDIKLFRDVIQLLVDRHASLRTRFLWKDDTLLQQVDGYQAAAVEIFDIARDEADRHIQAFHQRPFDLDTSPLLRGAIFREGPSSHVVMLSAHHTVLDGWSVYQLIDEMFTLYAALHRGQAAGLPVIRQTYDAYVEWQHRLLERDGARLQAYWEDLLRGKLPALELPTDHARPRHPTLKGLSLPLHLPSALCDQLKRIAREHGCTLYVVLLAAYLVLLHRYSGQDEVLVGLPMAGRSRPEFAEIVGYFVSPVVARAGFGDDPVFADFLARTKRQVLASLDHQDYPFSLLVERLGPERDVGRMPIFQASFVLQKPHRAQELVQAGQELHRGMVIEGIPIAYSAGQEDLALMLSEREGILSGYLQGSADIFEEATLARMARHLTVLLEDIASAPTGTNRPISRLRLLDEAERRQVLTDWNLPRDDGSPDLCSHLAFEAMTARAPDAVALIEGDRQLTYGDLNLRANRLAHYLRQRFGVGPEALVGIALERSSEMVVCLLASLKAGAAYLPLDPAYPQERLAYLLQDSRAAVLLTRKPLAGRFGQSAVTTCFIDDERQSIACQPGDNPQPCSDPGHLAYVIYTSGSTGQPKGVIVEHRALATHLSAVRTAYGITPKDRVLQFAAFGFDAAHEQILTALTSGAAVVLRGEDLWTVKEFNREAALRGITVADLPPAYFQQLVAAWQRDRPAFLDDQLRLIVVGGEAVRPELLRSWFQVAAPRTRLVNAYGPTEATITATLCDLGAIPATDALPAQLPIGRPLPGRKAFVLAPCGQPVPVGVWGELYLGGDGLARGYLNRPDLTAERFVDAPFAGEERLYRTGDRVRWLPDGQLAFLGRDDQQVKIRGFRVELEEIERALMEHPGIADAVVVAQEEEAAGLHLVAFVVHGQKDSAPDYRAFLRTKLPDYMLPADFVAVDALPLTLHGKVDRAALLAARPSNAPCAFPPRTPVEHRLAAIWKDLLKRDTVDVRNDFFAVGGHSILAIRLMREVQECFRVTLPLATLFQYPTIESLGRLLEEQNRETLWSPLVPIRPHGSRPPLFCVHGIDGNVMNFHALARALSDDQPVYGLQAHGLDGETPPLTTVEAMAAAYLGAVRTVQLTGPYFLAGHSFGGEVAFEMAHQLQGLGEEVGLLVLIDSYAPGTLPDEIYGINDTARFVEAARYVGIALGDAPIPISAEDLEGLSPEERLDQLGRHLVPAFRVCLANLEIRYRPAASIVVPTIVFRADSVPEGQQPSEDSLGWQSCIAVPIAAHSVPGNHFTLLQEPWVRQWAHELQRRLDEAVRG